MSAVVNGGGAVINGASGGGASLPDTPANVLLDAGNADEVVALNGLGVGTTKTYAEVILNGIGSVTESAAEGDFVVGDGAGGTQLASVDPAAVRAVIGAAAGTTTTTYYASNGTAANGAGVDATASVSGTGSSSTVAYAVSSTQRLLNSSGIACGSWASPSIPQTVTRITLYLRSISVSGFGAGYRWLQCSLRRAGENPPASMLLGVASADNGNYTAGNMRNNSNNASFGLGVFAGTTPMGGADRWMRWVWTPDSGSVSVRASVGATTGATRPTFWTPVNLNTQVQADTRANLGSMGTSDIQVILGLESYGSGGASSLTLSLALEVET